MVNNVEDNRMSVHRNITFLGYIIKYEKVLKQIFTSVK